MKIFIDENIPFAEEFFADLGDVIRFPGREISAEQLIDADVLLVRSITQVDEQLLSLNNKIKFVGTATIGVDHIDQTYLQQRGIAFSSAPGCNAVSVAEYVLSAMLVLSQRLDFDLRDKTVGIVGGGNTGSQLAKKLDAVGVKYSLCDPLLQQSGDTRTFVELPEIMQCDIISLHVPITRDGDSPTFHMFDDTELSRLSSAQILINACRGEVINNHALLAIKKQNKGPHIVLDVWESEPDILTELIDYCQLATAHIAGYSLEGKSRGTEMLYHAFLQENAGIVKNNSEMVDKTLSAYLPEHDFMRDSEGKLEAVDTCIGEGFSEGFKEVINHVLRVYDVRRDDKIFRTQLGDKTFDYLRKNYPVRREFSALELTPQNMSNVMILQNLGFTIKHL
ncbi:4-phosphoerythronate dehydrogenase [Thalassotalea crassostreae]|uniref:4-phosphoerythronate dehydrogenase n=1 Tax=Thalassotalea crassostreae TaxID=1763536 RepID=UPI0008388B91|nr:4-phosphoerythronate dehydrogenase [Thalassotalea crassostreae]